MKTTIDTNGKITNLIECLGNDFPLIENPSRYIPSEYSIIDKKYINTDFKAAMCFPDLYEIGMSNNAIRILFDLINKIPGVFCDRVFAVAPDFEKLLRDTNTPLFTIKENLAVNRLDFLGITIGCELLATNILQILDLSNIKIDKNKRIESDPIVIAGGPAVTNPLPFSKFVDFVYIGEAENGLQEIILEMKKYKTRTERIKALKSFPFLWYPEKEKAIRSIDLTFGTEKENPVLKYYTVPAFQVAQDHGTVEIMRGCPNGCRFCHAGQFYKPYRQRSIETVKSLVKQNVDDFGYREITLSSLSSGDYPNLDMLISELNKEYKERNISFSLPSLRVSTFALNILEQISEVRKSGLTFAIETADLTDQKGLNKEVPLQNIIPIIKEAKAKGWRLAKFYFMVGLPFIDKDTEQQKMVSFIRKIWEETKINMNINIGTFIPKAHTPFQWARQMSLQESEEHLKNIKHTLTAAVPGIKVSYHEPSISFLEGIISRGGIKCADLIEKAYEYGCRLDAWDEYIKWDMWLKAINDLNYDINFREYQTDEPLPWDSVSLCVSKPYLIKEYAKAKEKILSGTCKQNCDHNCGVCSKNQKILPAQNIPETQEKQTLKEEYKEYSQVVFCYSKTGKAVYCSHISTMRQFEMAFQRASLHVKFTEGFNPKPKMEFLNPISLGVEGKNELLLVELPQDEINENSILRLNESLAEGFYVKNLRKIPKNKTGAKISLSSIMKGSLYSFSDIKDSEILRILEEKTGETEDYCLNKENERFLLELKGEKNIFKLIFGQEINKFHIAGSCKLVREEIYLKKF